MGDVVCFWLEPTDRVRLWLRRFVYSDAMKCPLPDGYHNAMAPFGEQPARYSTEGIGGRRYYASFDALGPARGDPQWPTRCACGYAFRDEDTWQVFQQGIYRRVNTGAEMTIEDAPAGAMWDAWWYGEPRYPDGIQLMVKLPNGSDWWVDGPFAGGGGSWTRTGTPPVVTASPSIWSRRDLPNSYHGWLRDGVLRPV
jgi:hypothetical protein